MQRTVESRRENRYEDSYSDRREFKVQTQAQDGLYRFQADDNQKLESRNSKDRIKSDNKFDRIMHLPKQSKQSRNDFDFYSTDPYVRKETKKTQMIFPDPIEDEGLIRNVSKVYGIFRRRTETQKTEAAYEEWLYEIQCVQKDGVYSDQAIGQAIRKSLKGQAKQVLMPLGVTVTIEQILNKLEAVFGNVAMGDSVMQEFFTAAQNQGETVTAWNIRLEDIVQKAVKKGHVRKEEKDKKLRDRFWNY